MSGDRGRAEKREPAYDLEQVQKAFRGGRYLVTRRVRRHLRARGWDVPMVLGCISALEPGDLYKSQAHLARPQVWLDIYRPRYQGRRLYVKFTVNEDGERMLLLTFCNDGEAH